MNTTKHFFSLIVLLVLAQGALAAKTYIPFSKTLSTQKEVKPSTLISLSHRYGDVAISVWNQETIKIEATVTGEIKDEDELDELYEVLMKDFIKGDENIFIHAAIERYNSNVIQLGTKRIVNNDLKFVSGESFKVSDFQMKLKVFLPNRHRLALNTKYHDLKIDAYEGELAVSHDNGTFTAGELRGETKITMKYGKVNIGKARRLQLSAYDGSVELGSVDEMVLNAKYSTINIGKCNEASVTSYDDDVNFGDLQRLNLTTKYSSITCGNIAELKADLYDGKVQFGNAAKAEINAKYAQLKMGVIGSLSMKSSYDNNVYIELVDLLLISSSKYSTYRIQAVSGSLTMDSYDDDVKVALVSETMSDINLKVKYGSYDFTMHKDYQHRLKVSSNSTDIKYPKAHYSVTSAKSEQSSSSMDAQTTGYSGGNNVVIDAYSCDIQLGL